MIADTRWGSEFEGVIPSTQELEECLPIAVQSIGSGDWESALGLLKRVYEAQPVDGVSLLELASAIRLLSHDDARGGVARLHFALGRHMPTAVLDAVLAQLATKLLEAGDSRWAALAWMLHSEGLEKLRALVEDGAVRPSWISDEGHEALEDLVFERADQTNDAGWRALSARLASQDTGSEVDESAVLMHAKPSDRHNPRAWGLYIQVLLALDRTSEATNAEAEAVALLRESPRQLLEVLDAADADDALPRIVEELEQSQPQWLVGRPPESAEEAPTPKHSARHALQTGLDLALNPPRLLDDVVQILPEPPRRTDDEWLERKRKGDAAMIHWLRTRAAAVGVIVVVAWLAYQLL